MVPPEEDNKILENLTPEQREMVRIDNDGNVVANNRANRRKFPPSDPNLTKSTWSRQSRSELKRKRKLGRK